MGHPQFKYIYGPVHSWRLGMSLGIDPLSTVSKYCSFECSYCQLGQAEHFSLERKVFVPTEAIVKEVAAIPDGTKIDYLTFSGKGEPTLAANLGQMMWQLRKVRLEKFAVVTNGSTMTLPDVQADLRFADFILFKLDAPNQEIFEKVDHPFPGIKLEDIIREIRKFKRTYEGRIALQMMFVEDNKAYAADMAKIARDLNPDEVQINTPLRPSPVKPLSEREIWDIAGHFQGMNVLTVYGEDRKDYRPFDDDATEQRHGKFKL